MKFQAWWISSPLEYLMTVHTLLQGQMPLISMRLHLRPQVYSSHSLRLRTASSFPKSHPSQQVSPPNIFRRNRQVLETSNNFKDSHQALSNHSRLVFSSLSRRASNKILKPLDIRVLDRRCLPCLQAMDRIYLHPKLECRPPCRSMRSLLAGPANGALLMHQPPDFLILRLYSNE